jgi:hypothetical protein
VRFSAAVSAGKSARDELLWVDEAVVATVQTLRSGALAEGFDALGEAELALGCASVGGTPSCDALDQLRELLELYQSATPTP